MCLHYQQWFVVLVLKVVAISCPSERSGRILSLLLSDLIVVQRKFPHSALFVSPQTQVHLSDPFQFKREKFGT